MGVDPFDGAPEAMGEFSGLLLDSWPHIFVGLTLFSSLYVSMTQCLHQDEEMSLLEEVFSIATMCTGIAALVTVSSLGIGDMATALESVEDSGVVSGALGSGNTSIAAGVQGFGENAEEDSSLFCQTQGALVAYFQLATVLWLTAGSHSVYRFVCDKNTSTIVTVSEGRSADHKQKKANKTAQQNSGESSAANNSSASIEKQTQELDARMLADSKLTPPSPTKVMKIMQLYKMVCFGVPTASVAWMMLVYRDPPVFGYQQLHTTGWCTVNMSRPGVVLILFYLPIVCCMFYTASVYFFCFLEVKVKQDLLGSIENEVLYDQGAVLIQKKIELSFDHNHRASALIRIALMCTSFCWTPPSMFAIVMVGATAGAAEGDLGQNQWLLQFRNFSRCINPMYGFMLYLLMEHCFNLRDRYNNSLHRRIRRVRFRLCGAPPHKTQGVNIKIDDKLEKHFAQDLILSLLNGIWQLCQLVAFSPWALSVWVPLDTFKTETKSRRRLTIIGVMYLTFLLLPAFMMFYLLPNFYSSISSLVDNAANANDDDGSKNSLMIGAVLFALGWVLGIGGAAAIHITSANENRLTLPFYIGFYTCVATAPFVFVQTTMGGVVEFITDPSKADINYYEFQHKVSILVTRFYLVVMFGVVAMTMWISRLKPSLNYIEHPRSHVAWNSTNLRNVLTQLITAVQLSSLLLTHSAFTAQPEYWKHDLMFHHWGNATNQTTYDHDVIYGPNGTWTIVSTVSDDFTINMDFLSSVLANPSFLKKNYSNVMNKSFEMKLYFSLLAVMLWVVIVMVPVVLETVSLKQSKLFATIYSQLTVVQELLSGPLFLVILGAFLSTMDCKRGCPEVANGEGQMVQAQHCDESISIWVLEDAPAVECWVGKHLFFVTAGLTGLMAYVPLACLTMVVHDPPDLHFRYTPLFTRLDIITKGMMAMVAQYTNTLAPQYSFPFIMALAFFMARANDTMQPCCIIWANDIKSCGFYLQIWTGAAGLLIYWHYQEDAIFQNLGVPAKALAVFTSGWAIIGYHFGMQMRHKRLLLKRPSKKARKGPVAAWSDYLRQEADFQDKLQSKKINSLRLAARPDDTVIRYNTHHEVLLLIYIMKSNATAGTKQRALQVLSAAAGSTSAKASLKEMIQDNRNAEKKITEEEGGVVDSTDPLERTEENVVAISVQTRRRLLGFTGDEHDLEDDDYHFPQVVLVSPTSLVNLLADEFFLTRERDSAAEKKFNAVWVSKKRKTAEQLKKDAELEAAKSKKAKLKEAKAAKKAAQAAKKAGISIDEQDLTDVDRKTAEILYLLKRAKHMINNEVVAEFGNQLPKQFIVNTMLSNIRKHPPDVLRLAVSGAGSTTMGANQDEFHDENLLQHIMELDPERLLRGVDEQEENALRQIRTIRRMYNSTAIHMMFEKLQDLPDETLSRDDFESLLVNSDGKPEAREHHLLVRISRLEKEKQLLDNEIRAEKDKAISNVAKVYLIRILSVYAEAPAFCTRIMMEIGPKPFLDYLMHGDIHLQAASTVALFQLARQDPGVLDALQNFDGGMVHVATKLTHPDDNSIVMHRIAADLLVEIAKRFELRDSLINSGVVGALIKLADAYCHTLMKTQSGMRLRAKVLKEFDTFKPRHEVTQAELDTNDSMPNSRRVGDTVIMDTSQIDSWCPFEMKGVDIFGTHMVMSLLRVLQQLGDEESFRAEFVGRFNGVVWLRDICYNVTQEEVKVMTLRVLLGISVDPFGFEDILEDDSMLTFYLKLVKYKEDDDQIEPIEYHSRSSVLRVKYHRVADFLGLEHHNEQRINKVRKISRFVIVSKPSAGSVYRTNFHDDHLLEIVRERTMEECFDMLSSASDNVASHAISNAAVSVLVSLCESVTRLEPSLYTRVFSRMTTLRGRAIKAGDIVTYEEVVSSMVRMARNHRAAMSADHLRTAHDVFEQLWLFHHMLGKDLATSIKTTYWVKVKKILTLQTIGYVTSVDNTSLHKREARVRFMEDKSIKLFFDDYDGKSKSSDAAENAATDALMRTFQVNLKPRTRAKWNAGVSKAKRLSKLGVALYAKKKAKKQQAKKLVGAQIEDKQADDHRIESLKAFSDMNLIAELQTNESMSQVHNTGQKTENVVKFVNPLEDDEDLEAGETIPPMLVTSAARFQQPLPQFISLTRFEAPLRKFNGLYRKEEVVVTEGSAAQPLPRYKDTKGNYLGCDEEEDWAHRWYVTTQVPQGSGSPYVDGAYIHVPKGMIPEGTKNWNVVVDEIEDVWRITQLNWTAMTNDEMARDEEEKIRLEEAAIHELDLDAENERKQVLQQVKQQQDQDSKKVLLVNPILVDDSVLEKMQEIEQEPTISESASKRERQLSDEEKQVEIALELVMQKQMILFHGNQSDLSDFPPEWPESVQKTAKDKARHAANIYVVQELAKVLKDHPSIYILVDAHGDSGKRNEDGYDMHTGSYGSDLFTRRARAVKTALEVEGVTSGQIDVCGSGNTGHDPITGARVPPFANRRVYISTIAKEDVGVQMKLNCIFVWADQDSNGRLSMDEWRRLRLELTGKEASGLDFRQACLIINANDQLGLTRGEFEMEYKQKKRNVHKDFEALGSPYYDPFYLA